MGFASRAEKKEGFLASLGMTAMGAGDGGAATGTATVTVLTQAEGIQQAIGLVDQLVAAGKLQRLAGAALKVELNVALGLVQRGRPVLAGATLNGVVQTIDGLVRAGKISAADANGLRGLVVRLRQSVAP